MQLEFKHRFLGLYAMVLRHSGELLLILHQIVRNSLRPTTVRMKKRSCGYATVVGLR